MRRTQLIADARAAGLRVREDNSGTQIKRGSVLVRIWPNGDILRDDVRLDLTINMTVTQAARLLNLEN